MKTLTHVTPNQALRAMILFWDEAYKRTGSSDIADILGDLSLLPDGSTADPAAYNDFLQCLDRVASGDDAAVYMKLRRQGNNDQ